MRYVYFSVAIILLMLNIQGCFSAQLNVFWNWRWHMRVEGEASLLYSDVRFHGRLIVNPLHLTFAPSSSPKALSMCKWLEQGQEYIYIYSWRIRWSGKEINVSLIYIFVVVVLSRCGRGHSLRTRLWFSYVYVCNISSHMKHLLHVNSKIRDVGPAYRKYHFLQILSEPKQRESVFLKFCVKGFVIKGSIVKYNR